MAFIIVRYPAWNMGLHIQYLIGQDSKLTTYYIFQIYNYSHTIYVYYRALSSTTLLFAVYICKI